MKGTRVVRIFIGPGEVAGYYSSLAKGFKGIGVACDYISYSSHPFGYGGETRAPLVLRLAKFFDALSKTGRGPRFVRTVLAWPGAALSALWGVFAIFRYDVFIFGFGHSLIPGRNWDLAILRWLGKTVISNVAHGSEARPPYINGSYQSEDGAIQPRVGWLARRTRLWRSRLRRIEEYSDVVVGAPFSTAHFAEKEFVNWFALGVPLMPSDECRPGREGLVREAGQDGKRLLRVLHAPSHPAAKGSIKITEAIERLKQKGYDLELISLHGKPHASVVEEMQKCDFVVDQLYSDTPMASFAAEAAWFGRPAVVAGYGLDRLKSFVPEGMWPPSRTCRPGEIEGAIEDLIVDSEERLRLGKEAQDFVHDKWTAAAVARRYLRLIEGDVPKEWFVDPYKIIYLEGVGQPVERTKEAVELMVEKYGVQSLQLSHRPDLEKAFLEFAGIKAAH